MASMDGTMMKYLFRTARCASLNVRFGKFSLKLACSSSLILAQLSGCRACASELRNVSISCSVMALVSVATKCGHEGVYSCGKVAGIGVGEACADVGKG